MGLVFKLIFLLLVGLVGFAFHLRNGQAVTVDYYLGTVDVPLSVVVAVILLIGAGLGGSMNLWVLYRQRRRIGELRRSLKRIEKQQPPSAAAAVKDAG
jgi:putative membrane protein